jgi:hypothetical protein
MARVSCSNSGPDFANTSPRFAFSTTCRGEAAGPGNRPRLPQRGILWCYFA